MMMRELKTRFGGHWTGVVWFLGMPIAQLLMMMWMNTVIRGRIARDQYEFIVFLLVGLMPYRLFKSLWGQLTNAVQANGGLFGFKQVKPADAFAARIILEITVDALIFVLMATLLARLGYGPMLPVDLLQFLGVVAVFCLLGIGLGISSAVIVDVLPRFGNLISIISMPLMILSGVIFPLHNLPPEMLAWLLLNPVLHLVELARLAYLPGYVMVQGVNAWFPMWVTLVLVTVGLSLYRVRRRQLVSR